MHRRHWHADHPRQLRFMNATIRPAYSHMNTNQKVEGSPSSGIGVVVRYFLRRLAMAHRKSAKPRVQYANALAETVLVFVALPIAGITSFFLVISAKWGANPIIETLGIAPQIGGIVFGALAMLVGYLLLNK